MEQGGIFLTFQEIESDGDLKQAVSRYALKRLGGVAVLPPSADEEGLAQLSVKDARLFLNNCGEKTIAALDFIVSMNGRFTSPEILKHLKSDNLRGVWTGLTRRVRNVTGKDDALLINWFWVSDEWRGVMAAQTVAALRTALAQRG